MNVRLAPHRAEALQALLDAVESGVGETLFFDDVPLRAANSLARFKHLRPLHRAVANQRILLICVVLLHMNRLRPAWVALHHRNRISAGVHAMSDVKLHDDILIGLAEEDVPRDLTIKQLKFDRVIVVPNAHSEWLCLLGGLVEYLHRLAPCVGGLAVFLRQAGNDQVAVSDDLVEFHGLSELVANQIVNANVCAAAFQVVVIEHLAQFGRGAIVIARKLNTLEANLGDPSECSWKIRRTQLANGIELHADRYLACSLQEAGETRTGEVAKSTSGNCVHRDIPIHSYNFRCARDSIARVRSVFIFLLTSAMWAAAEPTAAIKVDQAGYLSQARKLAVVVSSNPSERFSLKRDSDGKAVYSGTLSAPMQDSNSGDRVQLADFSEFREAGKYFLDVPGAGRSYTFEVGADVYRRAYYLAMRSFYGQRCGMAVNMGPEFPQFRYDECHRKGAWHASSGKSGERESSHGWHDAGDYGRYVVNSGLSTGTLLWSWELFGKRIGATPLHIPESGNGTPDILNEIRWNLEWMLSMQDQDGGVWAKQTSENFTGFVMPPRDLAVSYVIGATDATEQNDLCFW